MTDTALDTGNAVPSTDMIPSVHLINEDKQFAEKLEDYVDRSYIGKSDDDTGLNYHIVSVFGSQSTGKSTLLNKLFGTQFDIMDEAKRQQTTKGIWFSHANYIASANDEVSGKQTNGKNIYVLDVEGVDGRERADDKDFERKSALFALATSEVLIVNIFEHQVGLYQGANMELLKTVMEVNLSLFHKQHEKCLLLFVIRDFTGLTPLSNLGQSLEGDMSKIWEDLNKPEDCKDSKLDDFFDLKFSSISHKHFKPDDFELDIKRLGDEFSSDDLFADNKYHKQIPVDAWALYSQQIWDQIDNNKDLDLPTQQILVSKFKCNEIANSIYSDIFTPGFSEGDSLADRVAGTETLKTLRSTCLVDYDLHASRYKATVYEDIKKELADKMDIKLVEYQTHCLSTLADELSSAVDTKFTSLKKQNKGETVEKLIQTVVDSTSERYDTESTYYLIVDDVKSNDRYSENISIQKNYLISKVAEAVKKIKLKASKNLLSKLCKTFQSNFKDVVVEELSQPTSKSWDDIELKFEDLKEKLLKPYQFNGTFDFKFGLTPIQNERLHVKIEKRIWDLFDSVVHDFINDDAASRILRNIFEDNFKYDVRGTPLILETIQQIDACFTVAKNKATEMLPVLSNMKKSNGKSIVKSIFKSERDAEDDDDDDGNDYISDKDSGDESEHGTVDRFSTLLTPKDQAKVLQRFKRESDAIYLDTKRAMISNRTSIPPYIWLIILVLGWNEFMIVLKNPIFFMLALMALGGFYVSYNTQMLGPLFTVGEAMLGQTKVVMKEKMRDMLSDEHETKPKSPSNNGSRMKNM